MVLQASGSISLGDIASEFGGVNPHGIGEYYEGGAYVPINTGVPTEGYVMLSDFYGKDYVASPVGEWELTLVSVPDYPGPVWTAGFDPAIVDLHGSCVPDNPQDYASSEFAARTMTEPLQFKDYYRYGLAQVKMNWYETIILLNRYPWETPDPTWHMFDKLTVTTLGGTQELLRINASVQANYGADPQTLMLSWSGWHGLTLSTDPITFTFE